MVPLGVKICCVPWSAPSSRAWGRGRERACRRMLRSSLREPRAGASCRFPHAEGGLAGANQLFGIPLAEPPHARVNTHLLWSVSSIYMRSRLREAPRGPPVLDRTPARAAAGSGCIYLSCLLSWHLEPEAASTTVACLALASERSPPIQRAHTLNAPSFNIPNPRAKLSARALPPSPSR